MAAVRIMTAGLLVAGLSLSALFGRAEEELGKVLRVRPMVKVKEGSTRFEPLEENASIRFGQIIKTHKNAAVRMSFDDDGVLTLWPSTRVVLLQPGPADHRYSACTTGVAARIEVQQGILQVDHDPKKVYLKRKILEIETPDAFICLVGTSIEVHVDTDPKNTKVVVWETGAWVRHREGGEWKELKAKQQTVVRERKEIVVTAAGRRTTVEPEALFVDPPALDRVAH